jgi:hypothetical protein
MWNFRIEQLPFAGCRLGHSADFGEDFVFAENQILLAVNRDVVSGVFAEQDAIADLDVKGAAMALFHFSAANGDNFALMGFLLSRIWDDDSTFSFSSSLRTRTRSCSGVIFTVIFFDLHSIYSRNSGMKLFVAPAPPLRAKTLHILQPFQRKLIRFLLLTVGFLLWAF